MVVKGSRYSSLVFRKSALVVATCRKSIARDRNLSQLGAGGSQLTAFGRIFPEALGNGSLVRR